ncbi:unnamed protein product [Owenia fusiformis]|uniref:Piwi n=1 Tax=Owenia fusiformis TaxID=6347 RepID=A0A8S4Q4N7_OWEFU|nr:unnamed protein product [Owenia fusiformis]
MGKKGRGRSRGRARADVDLDAPVRRPGEPVVEEDFPTLSAPPPAANAWGRGAIPKIPGGQNGARNNSSPPNGDGHPNRPHPDGATHPNAPMRHPGEPVAKEDFPTLSGPPPTANAWGRGAIPKIPGGQNGARNNAPHPIGDGYPHVHPNGATQPNGSARGRGRGARKESPPGVGLHSDLPLASSGAGLETQVKNLVINQAPLPGQQQQQEQGGGAMGGDEAALNVNNDAAEQGNAQALMRYQPQIIRPDHIKEGAQGTLGEAVVLSTNYYKFLQVPNHVVYKYHVDMDPQVDSLKRRKQILNRFAFAEQLGDVVEFDGCGLYLPRRLIDLPLELYREQRDGTRIRITIRDIHEVQPGSPDFLHLLNIVLRNVMKHDLGMQLIKRDFFDPEQKVRIERHGFEVWPGIETAIMSYQGNVLMMSADILHKIVRTCTVLGRMHELAVDHRTGRCLDRDRAYEAFARELVGSSILTKYNNKQRQIIDIDMDSSPLSKFTWRGQDTTFKEYYMKQYNIQLLDDDQPLILVKPKDAERRRGINQVLLVPELCLMTGLTEAVRSDYRVMQDIAVHTRLSAAERVKRLEGFNNRFRNTENAARRLDTWGIKFDDKMVSLQGRLQSAEKIYMGIYMGKKHNFKVGPNADWSREMRDVPMLVPVSLKSWLFVYTQRDERIAQNLLRTLKKVGPPMGMVIEDPETVVIYQNRIGDWVRSITDNIRHKETQIVMPLLPTKNVPLYNAIKKTVCLDVPMYSQCVVANTVRDERKVMSIATKIAIQMTCKLGGAPWMTSSIPEQLLGIMVVGIDVNHDTTTSRSVCGFVATMNNTFTKYHTQSYLEPKFAEIQSNLETRFAISYNRYREQNGGELPKHIYVYRDGVGDGQINIVLEEEVRAINHSLDKCYTANGHKKPGLTVVIIKKKISTRFFLRDGRGTMNPPPGTIVDSQITRPEWFDFFMVSQSVRQGTVTPTHFNVIYDTNRWQPNYHEKLAYKMCHLYYNWQGTVRVPAPCLYAHKAAFLVGTALGGKSIHKDLEGTLAYL